MLLLTRLVLLLALLRCLSAADPPPTCLRPVSGQFLAVSEWVIVDAVPSVPAALRARAEVRLPDYLAALGHAPAPTAVTGLGPEALLVPCRGRWLVVTQYQTLVRRGAVGAIDAHPGLQQLVPPTPAVPGGAQVLAQPEAAGVTLAVGTARVFCGVRTAARSLAISHADLLSLAQQVGVPTSAQALALVDP